jgi:LuxR family maltose regulon positive regulatory protein
VNGATIPPSPVARPLIEPLSTSELRVLHYLPTHLTMAQIAGELYVSLNTIRTHMRHLYTKLGTHRRADTVERARALGLLAPARRPIRQRIISPSDSRRGPGGNQGSGQPPR